jgi:hypothetical protein
MRRSRLRRSTPLRPGRPPARRISIARRTPLRRVALRTADRAGDGRVTRPPMAASDVQRAKIVGSSCVVCRQTKALTPAHLAPRALGGCDEPDWVVPLCWMHHRAYDTGRLELLPYLEPRWRAEVAHAVLHLGLIGAVRRLRGRRG